MAMTSGSGAKSGGVEGKAQTHPYVMATSAHEVRSDIVPEAKPAGDLPLSGGLGSSPLFSNMARRFLTWLMLSKLAVDLAEKCLWCD